MRFRGVPAGIGGVLRCVDCLRRIRRVRILDAYDCPDCGALYARIDIWKAGHDGRRR